MDLQQPWTRRDFLRHACAATGVLTWGGCRSAAPRSDRPGTHVRFQPDQDLAPLVSEEMFRRLVDAAFKAADVADVAVRLHDRIVGSTGFERGTIYEDRSQSERVLSVFVEIDGCRGRAVTGEALPEAVAEAVKRAIDDARNEEQHCAVWSPVERLPMRYLVLPTYRLETAIADASHRRREAERAQAELGALGGVCCGTVNTVRESVGVAHKQGLFAWEARTMAELLLQPENPGSTCPIYALHRSIDDLETQETIRRWLPAWQARERANSVTPGRYSLILGPEAVAQLAGVLVQAAFEMRQSSGNAAFDVEPGAALFSEEISIRNHPQHPALLGCGFDASGRATNARAWFEHGMLVSPSGVETAVSEGQTDGGPACLPNALCIQGTNPGADDTAELIRGVRRGLYIAAFKSLTPANSNSVRLNARSVFGVYRIENGLLAGADRRVIRFDPIGVFSALKSYTRPLPAVIDFGAYAKCGVPPQIRKTLAPALAVEDFEFIPAHDEAPA